MFAAAVGALGLLGMSLAAPAANAQYWRAGWVAEIPPGDHDAQGVVTIVDETTLQVDNFTYDGTAPAVYFYLGEENTDIAFQNGLQVPPQLDRAYSDASLILSLPAGESMNDYNAISVWCAAFNVNFSSASFQPPECETMARCSETDVNCDQMTNGLDLAIVANPANWQMNVEDAATPRADVNGDGVVSGLDLAAISNPGCWMMPALLELSFDGLEPLGSGFAYEGWVIVDGMPVSTGRFVVDDQGQTYPEQFLVEANDAANATLFVLTIEPSPDPDPAPAATHVLAGPFDGFEAQLSIGHMAALGTDFSGASGEFILATPTTPDVAMDYNQGIWWVDPSGPAASLMLPELPAGWLYEGWVAGPDGPVTTGKFVMPAGADMDGAGPTSGMGGFPPFPGQDYIDPPLDLIGMAAVISVEPDPDDSPAPFAIKPLIDMNIQDVGGGTLQSMDNTSGNAPSGVAAFQTN